VLALKLEKQENQNNFDLTEKKQQKTSYNADMMEFKQKQGLQTRILCSSIICLSQPSYQG